MLHSRRTACVFSHLACALVLSLMAACGGGGGKANLMASVQPQADAEAQARRAAVLTEVEQAELPDAPDSSAITPEMWGELKSALKTALAAQPPEKLVSDVPTEELNKITTYTVTANDDGSATFRWRYRNLGDYNQDSTVSYMDLATLGFYYYADRVDLPEEEPIDGDLNGVIGQPDIVPLAMYWENTVSGYVLLAAASPDAPEEEWAAVATIPFADSALPADRNWRIFEYKLANPVDGQYYTVVPYYRDESNKGTSSDSVQFHSDAVGGPQNVTATQGTVGSAVELAWEPMLLALYYEVYRSTDLDSKFSYIGESEPLTAAYHDTAVTQGVHYWYKVRAWLSGGVSEYSTPVEGWPLNAPDSPLNLTASFNTYTDRVALAWQASPQAEDYQINRRPAIGGNYSVLGETTQTTFNDLVAQPGQEYSYTVVARNAAGSSAPSNEAAGLRCCGYAPEVLRVYPFEGTAGEPLEPIAMLRGGIPTSYSWNFGSGGLPEIQINSSPYLILGEPGIYPSSVHVANLAGEDLYIFALDVRPANTAPAVEDVYPLSGVEQSVVSFSATTSGGLPTSWSWNFGGGAQPPITITPSPVVTLGAPGSYNASVTVANPTGKDVHFFTLQVGSTPTAPAPPQNLTASDGGYEDRITLNWSPSAGAQGYKVYRDNQGIVYANVPGTALYVDLNVDDYLEHTYWVAAYNDIGTGAQSASDTGYRALPAPSALTASDGTFANLIRVSWTAVDGADGYQVYRDWDSDPVAEVGAVTAWDDANAGNYGLHIYYVMAVNAIQTSTLSPADNGYYGLGIPGGFSASDGSHTGFVRLGWTLVNGATSYMIYRDSTAGTPVATVDDVAEYDDAVGDFNQHTYWVRAANDLTSSGLSTSDTGYRGLAAPGNLTASDGTYGSYVRLDWDSVSGATGYKVYRDSQSSLIQTLGVVTTWNDPVGNYAGHTYWVRATYSMGDGAFSEPDTGYRGYPAPSTVTASDGTYEDHVAVTWSAVSGATGYNVYRGALLVGDNVAGTSLDDVPPDYAGYTYTVHTVIAGAGESGYYASDTGFRSLPAPATVTASDGTYTDRVAVSWSAVSGASGYNVYRGALLVGDNVTGTSLNDVPADYATYTYSVRAIQGGVRLSALSASDTGFRGLPAPAAVTASDGAYTDRVAVSWSAVSGASSYNVYRDTTLIGDQVAGPALNDTTVSDYAQHTYRVHVVNASGSENPASGADTGYRGLPAATNVDASDGDYTDRVSITWDAVSGAASYNVWRDSTQVGTHVSANNMDDTTVANFAVHTYKVYAVSASGTASSLYGTDTGYRGLPAPGGVSATDGTYSDRVDVAWNNVAGATGFNVYRGTLLVGEDIQFTNLPFHDTPADFAQYTYNVYAVFNGNESSMAGSDTGYRGLPAPTAVAASDGAYPDRVHVSWNTVSGAASYNIYRDAAQVASGVTGASTDDTPADYNQHTYTVKAVNAGGGESTYSNSDTGFRGLPAPGAVAATDGTHPDHVHITWNSVSSATSYNIYRTDKSHSVGSVAAGNPLQIDDYDSPFSVYNYLVYPVSGGGESMLHGDDTGYAGTGLITDLAASDGTFATRIRLTWSKVPGADEYRIYRSTSPGASALIATVGDVDLYDDTSGALVSGTPYYYRLRAYNSGTSELSGYSNEDTGYRAENNWQAPHTVDNTTISSFLYTDMTVIGGLPMISYWDAGNPSLDFARATTNLPGAPASWTHHTVDSSGAATIGKNGTSIAQVNGRPAIAYCNDTAGSLKYAYASSASPSSSSDWTVMTLEIGSVGNYPSLAVIGGRPAIVYHAQGANQLKFIQANVAVPLSAADWGAPYTLDTEAGSGEYGTSLIEMGGRAAAAYHASGSGKLKFARAAVATPANAGQWTLATVETGGLGQWPALANVGGVPAIAYVDNTNLSLRYAYASDADGTSWTPTLVDSHNRAGAFGLSMVVYGGVPVIAYHESVSADLLIATATSGSPAGPGSWDVVAADENDGGDYPALALLSDGNPGVAYGALTTALRFTRFVP